MKKEKNLVLVRHAHRDKSGGRHKDNGISPKGQAQVRELTRQITSIYPGKNVILVSSPKKRCLQTLGRLAGRWKLPVSVNLLLDEQGEAESRRHYQSRIQEFYHWWRAQSSVLVVACSHGDWIPDFTRLCLGTAIALKKGGWLQVSALDKKRPVSLKWVVQEKL